MIVLSTSVWNDSDEPRSVLLLNIWHPDLTQLERNTLTSISRIRGGVYWHDHNRGADREPRPLATFEMFTVIQSRDGVTGIWPSCLEPPQGWTRTERPMAVEECLAWVNSTSSTTRTTT